MLITTPSGFFNSKVRIAVVGVGGTGSYFVDQLIKLDTCLRALGGEGLTVTLIDPATVSSSNTVRQSFFASQRGMNKAEAKCWEAVNLHGKSDFSFKAVPFDPANEPLFSYDIIVTALDRPSVRYALHQKTCDSCLKKLWLDIGNDSHAGNVFLGETGRERTIPNVCDLIDYSVLDDEDALKKSCSAEESLTSQEFGVNQQAAHHAANFLWQLMRKGGVNYNGVVFDLNDFSSTHITSDQWPLFGFEGFGKLDGELEAVE